MNILKNKSKVQIMFHIIYLLILVIIRLLFLHNLLPKVTLKVHLNLKMHVINVTLQSIEHLLIIFKVFK